MSSELPECLTLVHTFRFDQPSRELQSIKSALMRGNTLEVRTVDDIQDGKIVPEYFVLYFRESFHEIMQRALEYIGTDIEIVDHQCIMKLGSEPGIAKKIHDVLDKDSVVYLIPEQFALSNISGNYTALLAKLN